MAACAWNLRKWLVIATIFFVLAKTGFIFCKMPKIGSIAARLLHSLRFLSRLNRLN
jgi:hypothetical protein